MNLSPGALLIGTRIASVVSGIAIFSFTSIAFAQEEPTAQPFDLTVVDLLLESRIHKPANQATAEERASAVEELTNIYLVSNLPRAKELGNTPRIKAQIELQERAILFNIFASDFLANNGATDQEIFNVYEEQVGIAPPQEFKARHILVDTQSAALTLIEELQGGADFATLAKENSTGPSGPSGGDLGWFTEEAMVEPFSVAVAAIEDGAFTATPVQTQFGWHVILREDSRDSSPPPLESVRDAIKQGIEQEKFQEFLNKLRSNASG